ncbi:O-antigen ligase family protein [Marinobacterium aestuarii]|nr:O-antigen ligase family protein [Marinobacterium aestuarii]
MSLKPMSPTAAPRDKALMLATLALLVWLPLPLGSNQEWSNGLFVLLTALLGGLWGLQKLYPGAAGNSGARQRGSALRKSIKPALPLFVLLVLCQLWVCVQLISGISLDTGASIQYLMLGCAYALLFLLIVGLFHTRSRLTLLLGVLVVSGTVQAFYGSLMTLSGIEWLLSGPKTSYIGTATGTFVNRNHLAGYLEMTLACGIGLLLALRDGRSFRWRHLLELLMGPKARLRLALVIMVIALVMTRSRMGNTAFFASLLIVGGLFVMLNREHRLRNGLILASLILIDVLVISQYFGLEKLKDRLINTQLQDQVVNGEVVSRANEIRDDLYIYAWPQLQQNPLTGSGAGSFEASFQRYPGEEIRAHFDHAHNDYLQFAIEYGAIGMLPLVFFVLGALYHALKALWRRESWYRSGVGFGAAMGIIALMIHSATDFNLQIPANAATFITLCAIAVLANSHSKPRSLE